MQFPDFQSLTANLGERVPFWEEMLQHPDYDSWWEERNVAARLSKPEPVMPGERTAIDFTLNDIAHIFQEGHRIVVQIQSSWFPIMAMSPQFFQDNPYAVPASDYRSCEIKVWNDSRVCIPAAAGVSPR